MTKKERVIAALNHQETDIIPFHADFTLQAHEKMAEYLKDRDFENKQGYHLHYGQYWGWPTELEEKPEHFKDDYGVIWNRSGVDKDIGIVDIPLIPDIENNTYIFPPIDEKRLRAEYEALLASKEDKFVFPGLGFSVFERAWSLCGMENVLMDMIASPNELQKLFNDICTYNLKIIDIAMEYDFDGMYFGDDWGQQKGLIMGPELWRKFIKPVMAKMYARVKEKNRYVLQHSCGDCSEILGDLIDIGLDCYQTFQPEIYDIVAIKKEFGKDLSFWGGISTQQLLPYATPEKIYDETKRIMEIMRADGGYIAAPTHALSFDVPEENILAMLKAFQNQ